MPLRPCLTCGKLSSSSRCPTHTGNGGAGWAGGRDRAAQHRFRTAVLAAAGHQCQHLDEDRNRCPIRSPLEAHHTSGSEDPSTGLALCPKHHRARDQFAR